MLNQVQHDGVPLLGEGFLTPPKVYHRADRPKTRGHRHVRGQETLAQQDWKKQIPHYVRNDVLPKAELLPNTYHPTPNT